jgi:UDP-2-acetamido-2,6-beta-L-arabino-hexul-4-ose reductase
MNVLVTGASGFIGKNVCLCLSQHGFQVTKLTSKSTDLSVNDAVATADAIVHLAGINRSENTHDFNRINVGFTEALCGQIKKRKTPVPIIFSSTSHVERDTPYGISKLHAENLIRETSHATGSPSLISRLSNVFGKWGLPYYNSVVSTFCYCIANNKPYKVYDPDNLLCLVHVDDVAEQWINWLKYPHPISKVIGCEPEYPITVRDLIVLIQQMNENYVNYTVGKTGVGFERKLLATFMSYMPQDRVVQFIEKKVDVRGSFAELIKTEISGQFSVLVARPGVTRGGHYHNLKFEKFIVVSGIATFRFKNLNSDERFSITVDASDECNKVVTAMPGWTHDLKNNGDSDLICFIWANEVFNPSEPDTFIESLDN